MKKIIAITGSLRKKSFNKMLAHAMKEGAPSSASVEVVGLEGIPLFNQDVEEAGIPDAVTSFKEKIDKAEGIVFVSPEYNHSVSGVMKNAIDWASRSTDDKEVFPGKAVALAGATPGGTATICAQMAWLPVIEVLGTRPFTQKQLRVGGAGDKFNDEGVLTDEDTKKFLVSFLKDFAEFI